MRILLLVAALCLACFYGYKLMGRLDRFLSSGRIVDERTDKRANRHGSARRSRPVRIHRISGSLGAEENPYAVQPERV